MLLLSCWDPAKDASQLIARSAVQVCFGKRKLGLMKKALELSILCRCEIGIIVFGANGNLHQWSSPRTSMKDLLQRYSEASSQTDPQQGGKEVSHLPVARRGAVHAGSPNPSRLHAGHFRRFWMCRPTWVRTSRTGMISKKTVMSSMVTKERCVFYSPQAQLHQYTLHAPRPSLPHAN